MFEFVEIFFKKNRKPSIIFMIIVFFLYICLEPSNNCDLNLKFICNISKLFSHPLIIGVIAFLIWCYCLVQFFRKDYNKDKTDIGDNDEKQLKNDIDNWLKANNIDVAKRYFLIDLLPYYIKKDRKEDILSKNFFKENEERNDNNFLQQTEPDINIQEQMQKAKLNTYNNSYLTFCLLIDRCIEIANNKEQPYCFQEIAEAFKLDWKGRRYLYYIAHSLLGTIGVLLKEYNNNEQINEKIPCVNASAVTKWERDHGNKWFCNGGIKAPAWCCYPEYKQEGEDDRNFILELCKIVKEANKDKKANEDKIKSLKNKYYELLKEEVKTKNEKIKQEENKFKFAEEKTLNELYKNYKENGIKMSYQELEKQAQENNNK